MPGAQPGFDEQTPAVADSAPTHLADLVRAAARRAPEHPALVCPGVDRRVWTWSALDTAVDVEAARLHAAGVRHGDRVALVLPTSAAYCVAFFGALRAGGVAVPLSPQEPSATLARLVSDAAARVLVGPDDPGSSAADAADVALLPPPTGSEAARPSGGHAEVESRAGPEDTAVLAYTSGTSGPARGAMLTHRALLANVRQCAALRPAPVTATDRVLLAIPLFHTYGLGPGLLQVAAAGATGVLLEHFDAAEALRVVAAERVTSVVGVPPMYSAWAALPADELGTGMATVRLLTSGAAPLPREVSQAVWTATGLRVHEGYGLTETGPVLATTLVDQEGKPGSVGKALPGVQLRLLDPDGTPLADPDEDLAEEDVLGAEAPAESDTGVIAARGDNLFSGYWPDGAHGPDRDGWVRTGDVGYFDADGDLHLVDRANDLIIVNGFNVYPQEVENVLRRLPGVAEAAAVGVPDERTGEAVEAVIVASGVSLTAEDVTTHCAHYLARYKVPVTVRFTEALPRSPTGKVARRLLR